MTLAITNTITHMREAVIEAGAKYELCDSIAADELRLFIDNNSDAYAEGFLYCGALLRHGRNWDALKAIEGAARGFGRRAAKAYMEEHCSGAKVSAVFSGNTIRVAVAVWMSATLAELARETA